MKSKTYILQHNWELKDNKVLCGVNGWNVKNGDDYFNLLKWDDFFDDNTFFNYISFNSPIKQKYGIKKIQDAHEWIQKSPSKCISFPISKKFKEILEQFNLPQHRFYPAILKHKDIDYEYFVFHILWSDFNNYVNYDKSTFSEWENRRTNLGNIYQVKSFEDWKNKEKELSKELFFNHISFKNPQLDLLWMPYPGYIISERLKNALETAKITGIKIEEITSISIEIED